MGLRLPTSTVHALPSRPPPASTIAARKPGIKPAACGTRSASHPLIASLLHVVLHKVDDRVAAGVQLLGPDVQAGVLVYACLYLLVLHHSQAHM